jgi:hypothetical protein
MRPRHGAEFVWTGDAGEGDKIADGILVSALCATPFFLQGRRDEDDRLAEVLLQVPNGPPLAPHFRSCWRDMVNSVASRSHVYDSK